MAYKCNISFGLVYIPIKLVTAAMDNDIGFNMIDSKSGSRIKYVKTNADGEKVENSDIVKGYEYEENKYVIFSDEDFEKIKSPKDKNIDIQCFVSVDEIEPVYYNKPYYVVPTGAEKAFNVLVKAMAETDKAAIAKTVLGTKETLIAIRSIDGALMLNTLYFHDEIRQCPYKSEDGSSGKELELAKSIIFGMEEHFEPRSYNDEYRERVLAAIKAKIDGREITAPKTPAGKGISDLMEALQRSLDEQISKKRESGAKKISSEKKSRAPKRKAAK